MRKCNYCNQRADSLYATYNNMLTPYCRNCNLSMLDNIGGFHIWEIVEKHRRCICYEDMYFT